MIVMVIIIAVMTTMIGVAIEDVAAVTMIEIAGGNLNSSTNMAYNEFIFSYP